MNEPFSRRELLRTAAGTGVAIGLVSGVGTAIGTDPTDSQTTIATNSDWPMFQHDAHNSGTLDTVGPSEPVEAVWTFETDDSLVAQPIVKDGTVFQASRDSRIYAVSADTGAEEWSVGTNQPLVRTPAVANSIVYVPTRTGRILGLSVGTGSGQWVNDTGVDAPSTVTVTGEGVVFAETDDAADHVYVLDPATGDRQSRFEIPDAFEFSLPTIADGRAYVYCRSPENGRHLLAAHTLSDGAESWRTRLTGDAYDDTNASSGTTYADYDGGTVFVGDGSGVLESRDAATGEQNWQFSNLGEIDTVPTFADDTLYVTTEEPALYAIDPSIGTEQWRVDLDGSPTSPVVADDMIYLGTGANSVYGFDAQSSEQRWRFETGNDVVVPPVVLDGTVYVASTDGSLYALREEGAISPGDVTGDGAPARDLDEDGLYEDVNGDGAFTVIDVQALFANLDSDVVQNNVSKFDFNGDGEVDIADIQALYARLQEGE
ncbi:outer membrane protein assembly factor BamB family protein [Halolamina sediminis]|jgi:outer membrane protein assembly factor BamB|uniref:outer membrane protein assembly factor BamB family protein n=1 Tax=Halolamina sediminis TaxID=1480675 RepID=UPI0006B48E2F|nr:PQQ-binding-like beta-propeller repeat protein [Halolamina sediminis]